ncbi:MAG TPA: S-layer homology domain-containing protein, partial [Candidatus Acidoferrum sp.]|nr:S-layer homology domain-containing protein [Candidatus Acidoferrum sp.]
MNSRLMKKALSLLLAAAMATAMLPLSALAAYTDTAGHYAQAAIEKWSDAGILTGDAGTFRPDAPITRGEMAVIIDRVMKFREKSENTFSDLGQDFYTDAVLKANAAGVMLGHDGMVRPADKITREDAAVMLGRALGVRESAAASAFSDAASVSDYAVGYVNALAAKGYIRGDQNMYRPKSGITRAEVVTILNNAIGGLFTEGKEYTGDVTGMAVVSAPDAVLKDMTITGDLLIAQGVGQGDVTLDNVKVTGATVIRGGGTNSIHIVGASELGPIYIEKTADGEIRVVKADGSAVGVIYVDDGDDAVILEGAFDDVTVNAEVEVRINSGSTVSTLTVNAQATIENKGTVTAAEVNADGVTLSGSKPKTVTVDPSVTEQP